MHVTQATQKFINKRFKRISTETAAQRCTSLKKLQEDAEKDNNLISLSSFFNFTSATNTEIQLTDDTTSPNETSIIADPPSAAEETNIAQEPSTAAVPPTAETTTKDFLLHELTNYLSKILDQNKQMCHEVQELRNEVQQLHNVVKQLSHEVKQLRELK